MNIGIIGLGRMGHGIAQRLINQGHNVFGCDPNTDAQGQAALIGVQIVTLEQMPRHTQVIWLMVPVGSPVDDVLKIIIPHCSHEHIIIDGGNSYYKDSMRRAQELAHQRILFLDCGTSGGLHGQEKGYCLMIGGDTHAYEVVLPALRAIAIENGIVHTGQSGTGHYVKMIHNGIEYALLQAYAEGFQLLEQGHFKNKLNKEQIAQTWNHGSIIRSWLLELIHSILKANPDFDTISGSIAEGGTGKWTVQEAKETGVPVPVIEESLAMRAWSRKTEGNYATKLIALIRHAFGGHAVGHIDRKK